jgi:RNA polymerase sigma factor (sigma-70 family)
MAPSASVTTWLAQLKAGDPDAAQALWERYFAQLVELARRHLARHVRRSADEEDVALSAFVSFCAGAAAGRFPRLTDRHDLWRLLLTLTVQQARKLARHESAQRRDARRVVTAADLFDLPDGDLDSLAGDSPDPALAAEVADELAHLLARLPNGELRDLATQLLAGYTAQEISRRVGCSLRTVERRWQRVRQFWQSAEPS